MFSVCSCLFAVLRTKRETEQNFKFDQKNKTKRNIGYAFELTFAFESASNITFLCSVQWSERFCYWELALYHTTWCRRHPENIKNTIMAEAVRPRHGPGYGPGRRLWPGAANQNAVPRTMLYAVFLKWKRQTECLSQSVNREILKKINRNCHPMVRVTAYLWRKSWTRFLYVINYTIHKIVKYANGDPLSTYTIPNGLYYTESGLSEARAPHDIVTPF